MGPARSLSLFSLRFGSGGVFLHVEVTLRLTLKFVTFLEDLSHPGVHTTPVRRGARRRAPARAGGRRAPAGGARALGACVGGAGL